jgi:hypothetical protein
MSGMLEDGGSPARAKEFTALRWPEKENPPPCCGGGLMVELSGVEPLTS